MDKDFEKDVLLCKRDWVRSVILLAFILLVISPPQNISFSPDKVSLRPEFVMRCSVMAWNAVPT